MQPPSLNGFPTESLNPVAPVQGAVHAVLHAGELALIGLSIGALALALLRRVPIHWGWGAVGLAPLLLLEPSPGAIWLLAPAALLTALGHRRSRRGRDAGVLPSARGRTAGVSPIGATGLLLRAAARRRRLRAARWFRGGRLLIGYDARLRAVEIELHGASGGRHQLVLGAPGSGKTVTMTWIATRAIERGLPVVVVDPKDDPELCAQVRRAAGVAGKELIEWTPSGPTVFNPLGRGQEGEIADKALSGETFTEPHYMRQAQRYVAHAVRALRAAGAEVSLASLVERLDPDRLRSLLEDLPEGAGAAGLAYVESLTARQRSDLAGVRDRLALLAESDVGRWLDPRSTDAPSFELLGALRSRAVVLFRLRSDQRALLMPILGAAIVLDLQTTAAALQGSPLPSVAVIDEFAALSASGIGGLFGRARGAGMSLVLGTQELADLELAGSDALRRQVTGNISTLISHRQANPESAEWVSRFSGEALGTASSRGERRALERMLEPIELRSLDTGCAAVIGVGSSRRGSRLEARVARILSAPSAAPGERRGGEP
jgi:TraM recognition site of TraD and TraG/Bacterial protein of unknown function (DUF853)